MNTYNDFDTIFSNLVQRFIDKAEPDPLNLRDFAAQKNLLPVLYDWSGVFTINSNSDIIAFDFKDLDPPKLDLEHPKFITDPRIRNMAIFQGSKKYFELGKLIPEKPVDAQICPHCQGTGIESTSAKMKVQNIICYCGGLGWIP